MPQKTTASCTGINNLPLVVVVGSCGVTELEIGYCPSKLAKTVQSGRRYLPTSLPSLHCFRSLPTTSIIKFAERIHL